MQDILLILKIKNSGENKTCLRTNLKILVNKKHLGDQTSDGVIVLFSCNHSNHTHTF